MCLNFKFFFRKIEKHNYMSGLTQRLITGIIFGVVMIGGVLYNELSFIILFGIIGAFCLWEFLEMSFKGNEANYILGRKILGVILGLLVYNLVFPAVSYTHLTLPTTPYV